MKQQETEMLNNSLQYLKLQNSLSKVQLENILKGSLNHKFITIISHLDNNQSQDLGTLLQNQQQLQSLNIQYSSNTLSTFQPLFYFGESLEKLQNLQQLEIDIQLQKYSNDLILNSQSLGKGLSLLLNLQKLRFKLDQFDQLNLESAKQFIKGVKDLAKLTQLSFDLSNQNTNIDTSAILEKFMKSVKDLINLQQFEMIIKCYKIQQNLIIDFDRLALQNLSNLQYLNFQISVLDPKFYLILKTETIPQFNQKLSNLKNLEKIIIKIKKIETDSQTLQDLSNGLFNIQSLQELEVNISFKFLLKKEDIRIIQSIKENSNLKRLTLHFIDISKNQQSHTLTFDESFQNLSQLKYFNFLIENVCLSSSSVSVLNSLYKNSNIEELKLQIQSQDQQYSEEFCQSLTSLTKLKELYLHLDSFRLFPKFRLAEGVQQLQNLQKLNVRLSLSYFGAYRSSLIDCFAKLGQIKELCLIFEIQNKFQDDMTIIGRSLKSLTNLTKLELSLTQITPFDNFEDIGQSFLALNQLKYLKITQINYFKDLINHNQFMNLVSQLNSLQNLEELYFNFFIRNSQLISTLTNDMIRHVIQLKQLKFITLKNFNAIELKTQLNKRFLRLINYSY